MSSVRNRRSDIKSAKSDSELNQTKTDKDSTSFSFKDVVRIISSVLLLNFVLSWYVTGTPLWGIETRWTNPRYVSFRVNHALNGNGYHTFSESELSQYNGQDPSKPIYVAVAGKVYDVSAKPQTYGPLGAYGFFAGRDAARAYVTGCFQTDLTHDLRNLDQIFDQETVDAKVQGWQRFYENNPKYWYVGQVVHPPLSGEPPKLCKGQQHPGAV